MPRYPLLEPALNVRGQLKLLIFFAALVFCHFSCVLHMVDYRIGQLLSDDRAFVACVVLMGICGVQVAWLALFNRFFRFPILRYALVGVAMELVALAGASFIAYIEPNIRNSVDQSLNWGERTIWVFVRLHEARETWTVLIYPALVAAVLAICFELFTGEYRRAHEVQKKSSDLLDDI